MITSIFELGNRKVFVEHPDDTVVTFEQYIPSGPGGQLVVNTLHAVCCINYIKCFDWLYLSYWTINPDSLHTIYLSTGKPILPKTMDGEVTILDDCYCLLTRNDGSFDLYLDSRTKFGERPD